MHKKTTSLALLSLFLLSCGGPDVTYRPAPQILPMHIKKLAVRPFLNKTQQFGLEEKLTLRVTDEFLRDGQFPVVPEGQADGAVVGEITRYILTPVQYDANLVPTVYKLDVIINLQFIDRTRNVILWTEPNLRGIQNYAAPTLPGGMTEEQAREAIWNILARDIVKRTVKGFGEATGISEKKVQ
ncbi:MAG: hypothetical protein HY400_01500 [Elusimicrobia bacterium]|nr:hypothetical protein [Elusimicrobiota bacterium]